MNKRVTISQLVREVRANLSQGDDFERVLDEVFLQHNTDARGRIVLRAEVHCRIKGSYPDPPYTPATFEKRLEVLQWYTSVLLNFQDDDVENAVYDAAVRGCRFYRIPLSERQPLISRIGRFYQKIGVYQREIVRKKRIALRTQAPL
jgi:hypothetical protein